MVCRENVFFVAAGNFVMLLQYRGWSQIGSKAKGPVCKHLGGSIGRNGI